MMSLLLVLASLAGVLGQVLTPQIGQYIQQIVALEQIPGLTVGVSRVSGASEFGAWGYRSEDGDAMTTDTLFDLGSGSKAFLSAAMGILIDDFARGRNTVPLPSGVSKFDWDTKVAAILPGQWKLEDPWASQKTNIADLLSHVTGLPRHDYSYRPTDNSSTLFKKLQALRPAFELREQWSYNNIMYTVGAYIISTYAGRNYTKFVTDRIFTPLNMSSSSFSFNAANASGKATQTFTVESGRRIPWWITDTEEELVAGPGGVISNVEDMDKWVRTMLNGGIDPRTNITIIPASAWTEVTTSRAVVQGFAQKTNPQYSIQGYGLGWFRDGYAGHDIIQHDGSVPGSSSLVTVAQLDGVAVTVLVNTDDPDDVTMSAITYEILDSILGITDTSGVTTPPPPTKRALAHRSLSHRTLSHRTLPSAATPAQTDPSPSRTFVGSYNNDGYGALTLCDAASASPDCTSVLGNFSALNGGPIPANSSNLFAAWATIWSSHALLVPAGGTTFQLYPTYIFPEGYGKNSTPFQNDHELIQGDLAIDFDGSEGSVVGFGLTGTVLQGPTMRQKEGGSIKHTADAWFDKVL
ncbi:beta-lactamase/transpeptidase-like protein [Artomyces pyxidatus]|uniref:Beta-lactamase/transpeptidase-like protein n=1 Tax=Artomyces pyxidatus TaxID=48021 RepID=A0ACB8T4N5_9AGAM|nr:beta-lactamase/transpeptidase-like protein [Artomyces pyxidatus]